MTASHLIWNDAQTFVHDTSLKVGRKEPVVSTKHEPRRHVGPCLERPWLLKWCRRLIAKVVQRLRGQIERKIVGKDLRGVERVGKLVTSVDPPLPRGLSRLGRHCRNHHEKAHRQPVTDD